MKTVGFSIRSRPTSSWIQGRRYHAHPGRSYSTASRLRSTLATWFCLGLRAILKEELANRMINNNYGSMILSLRNGSWSSQRIHRSIDNGGRRVSKPNFWWALRRSSTMASSCTLAAISKSKTILRHRPRRKARIQLPPRRLRGTAARLSSPMQCHHQLRLQAPLPPCRAHRSSCWTSST